MKKTILIIDDSPYILEGLKYVLKKKGYEVHLAEDGKQALELLNGIEVDIILTDLCMPNINGFDMTRQIKLNPKHSATPVIAYTGYVDERNLTEAKNAGILHIINKPLTVDDVISVLEKFT